MRRELRPSIVVKLGTQVLTDPEGRLNTTRVRHFVMMVAKMVQQGFSPVLVTSGAIGVGRERMAEVLRRSQGSVSGTKQPSVVTSRDSRNSDQDDSIGKTKGQSSEQIKFRSTLEEVESVLSSDEMGLKQAAAALGQPLLMSLYEREFRKFGIPVAQILVGADEFKNPLRLKNFQRTAKTLLNLGVIPIINENDTLSTQEIEGNFELLTFGDNDQLSALVAAQLRAKLLILSTNVDGLFLHSPLEWAKAQGNRSLPKMRPIARLYKELPATLDVRGKSQRGRGGMNTKLQAALFASKAGTDVVIVNGEKKNILTQALERVLFFETQGKDLETPGTWFFSKEKDFLAAQSSNQTSSQAKNRKNLALNSSKRKSLKKTIQKVKLK